MKIPPLTSEWKHIIRLPNALLVGVGDVITQWTCIETLMEQTWVWASGADKKIARFAFRSWPARQFGSTVHTMLDYRQIKIHFNYKALSKELGDLSDLRDVIAHGAWLLLPGNNIPHLRISRGWHADLAGTPKAMISEMRPYSSRDLHDIADRMRASGDELGRLINLVDAANRKLLGFDKQSPPESP